MKRDYKDYINDIYNSINEVKEFTKELNFETFLTDKKTSNAVIRSLEVLGESAKKIPNNMRSKYPDIPWKKMTGMRDKLIHEYFGVDLGIVWKVIKEELPPLKPKIKDILNHFK